MSKGHALVLAAALLPAVAAGCGSSPETRAVASGSCAAEVDFGGASYLGMKVHTPIQLGTRAGRAHVPACVDAVAVGDGVTTTSGSPAQAVEVVRLEDVRATVAIVRPDQTDVVYIRQGVCAGLTHEADVLRCLRTASP
jgi:hypothetical protein